MNCLNQITLVGHLKNKPQQIPGDNSGTRFQIVTKEAYFSKRFNERKVNIELHNVKTWKQNAKYALEALTDGDYVLVQGKMHYHQYTTEEGKRGVNPEVIAYRITKLNRGNGKYVKDINLTPEEEEAIDAADNGSN